MAYEMKQIDWIEEQDKERRLINQHAKALMQVLRIPEGNAIASLLNPSMHCSNQEAIAHWITNELDSSCETPSNTRIDDLAVRLGEYLQERHLIAS